MEEVTLLKENKLTSKMDIGMRHNKVDDNCNAEEQTICYLKQSVLTAGP